MPPSDAEEEGLEWTGGLAEKATWRSVMRPRRLERWWFHEKM